MNKARYLFPALLLFASCSSTPTESDALHKLNRVVNPTKNSFFRYVNLKIIKKSESQKNGLPSCFIEYSAVRKANKDIIERKNVIGGLEYIDTSISNGIGSQFSKKIEEGEIIDTLYASMTLFKSENGWK